MNSEAADNFQSFRDSLAVSIVGKLSQSTVKTSKKRRSKAGRASINVPSNVTVSNENDDQSDLAELSDFIEYLAEEIYANIPERLRTISYAAVKDDKEVAEQYALPLDGAVLAQVVDNLPPGISDSFCSYGIIKETSDLERFLDPVLNGYVIAATAAPPEYTPEISASRPDGCEICGREQLQLTYHHLIPRQVHAKAVKRGWHKEWQLNKVCWLCRACHSRVHSVATNEELAKDFYDVELLLARDDIQKWAAWVGRIRWKAR